MENINGNPYRGQSAHCADEWHVGSRLAGGRTCAGNLDAAAEIQGAWFRGVGSSSHICSFCHASRLKTSEPKASICTGQVFSRKSETFSQASEHHLTRLNTSSSDFVALVYLEYLAARVGGFASARADMSKPATNFCIGVHCPGHHGRTALIANLGGCNLDMGIVSACPCRVSRCQAAERKLGDWAD